MSELHTFVFRVCSKYHKWKFLAVNRFAAVAWVVSVAVLHLMLTVVMIVAFHAFYFNILG